jgi:hypothetical protein
VPYLCSMQKWKIMAVLALYLIGALGVHIQIHFCCGQLAGLEWNPDGDLNCNDSDNCCKKGDCCSSILIQADIEDEHFASAKWFSSQTTFVQITTYGNNDCCQRLASEKVVAEDVYRGPPPIAGKSRCCLFQNWKVDTMV